MAEVFKLGIAANNNQPIKEVNSIEVLANKGIVGDRHFHDFNDPYNQLSLICLLYTSPSPRDRTRSRMPSSA